MNWWNPRSPPSTAARHTPSQTGRTKDRTDRRRRRCRRRARRSAGQTPQPGCGRPQPAEPTQVHLIHAELFDEVADAGHVVRPGELGENITTIGIDLLSLATGAVLRVGRDAVVGVTGLRNPCGQIHHFRPGLLRRVLYRTPRGATVRKAGVMAVVLRGGIVAPGDLVETSPPPGPHVALEPV